MSICGGGGFLSLQGNLAPVNSFYKLSSDDNYNLIITKANFQLSALINSGRREIAPIDLLMISSGNYQRSPTIFEL